MKQFTFFLVVLLLSSCQSSKNEIVDINDIMAQSENYKEGENKNADTILIKEEVIINLNKELLREMKLNCEERTTSDTLLFPDRFSPISLTKFNYTTDKEVVSFTKYNFKDSLKTRNTFINWINCFGLNCKSIRIGESKNLQKNGFLLLANDTCIVYISANSSIEKKKWLNYYTAEKDISWKYILDQNKQGKVNWKSYQENSFTNIESNQ